MSEENKINHKDYTTHSNRVLNRLIKLREKQIEKAKTGNPSTNKNLMQLEYEKNAMVNTIMERAMTK